MRVVTLAPRAAVAAAALLVGPALLAAQTPVEGGRSAARDGTVKITLPAGSLRVLGWERDSVHVSGTLGPGADRLAMEGEPPETRIRVVLPREPTRPVEGSSLVVRVPRGSQVAAHTESGSIEAEAVVGGLDLESVSGDIQVGGSGRSRFVYARSVAGDVTIDMPTKSVRASSADGRVSVRQARGYVDLSSVSGAVSAEGDEVWEGRITTVTGAIRFAGSFHPEGSFHLESHAGDIELRLPAGARLDLEITSFARRVRNDFAPGQLRFLSSPPGARVRVVSFKGEVRVRKGP